MRGQAGIEAMMIMAAVLVVLAVFFAAGVRDNEVNSMVAAARLGAQTAITDLGLQYGDDIDITNWRIDSHDNIFIYLSVIGTPPPENNTIIFEVRDEARHQVSLAGGAIKYDVAVTLERVTK